MPSSKLTKYHPLYCISKHFIKKINIAFIQNNKIYNNKIIMFSLIQNYCRNRYFVSNNDNQTFLCLLKEHACLAFIIFFHHFLSWQSQYLTVKFFKLLWNICWNYTCVHLVLLQFGTQIFICLRNRKQTYLVDQLTVLFWVYAQCTASTFKVTDSGSY